MNNPAAAAAAANPCGSGNFVCTGNICRSPVAEKVFAYRIAEAGLADRVRVSSAGTGDWHIGESADNRARAVLRRHGYPVENEWSGVSHKGSPDAERQIGLLSNENEQLKGHITRLEERISVLERIATDPATRTAAEIDALRNT